MRVALAGCNLSSHGLNQETLFISNFSDTICVQVMFELIFIYYNLKKRRCTRQMVIYDALVVEY